MIVNNSQIFISSIEKTLIDCVYFSSKVYLTEINEFIRKFRNEFDKDLLLTYLNKVNSFVLNKRVGYLLEINNISINGLSINNKYEKLNKNLSAEGTQDRKWKLIINEDI